MGNTVHAISFLDQRLTDVPPVCVLFGAEPFLKQQVRRKLLDYFRVEDEEPLVSTFEGDAVPWVDVIDELSTVSLFGSGERRVVLFDDAGKFVEQNRTRLEDYVAKPRKNGVLILDLDSWNSNLRLYKAIDATGLQVDCRTVDPAELAKGKGPDVGSWLTRWAKKSHQITLKPDAAEAMLDLVGPQFGLLDQELAKLALFVEVGGTIEEPLVCDVVGGWRQKTNWELMDAVVNGDAAEALLQLDRLIHAGQEAVGLFGLISWSLRRFAAATRVFQAAERQGVSMTLRVALTRAGVKDWPPGTLANCEQQLKQLTRHRAGKLYRWLLELDLALKGSHSNPHRARFALEQLILKLSKQAAPRSAARS